MRVTVILLAVFTVGPGVSAQEQPPGFDLSALPLFWQTVDILTEDRMPTDAEWARLLDHPGYRQIERSGRRGRILREVMPWVFMPSQRATLDSALQGTSEELRPRLHRRVGRHLVRVRDLRRELEAYARELQASTLVAAAVDAAKAYLPAEELSDVEIPTAYVMLFENNGFGGASLALDLLTLRDRGVEQNRAYIGHELHHGFLRHVDRTRWPQGEDDHASVVSALSALYWEGMASMVDKKPYLDANARASLSGQDRENAEFFAEAYEDSPAVLGKLDSVLAGIHAGRLDPPTAGPETRPLFPWGGHPNGMYMATAIERAFGRDRLVGIADPLSFFLEYVEAASALGDRYRFSDPSVAYVRSLRERFVE